jgi:hypothetical protein
MIRSQMNETVQLKDSLQYASHPAGVVAVCRAGSISNNLAQTVSIRTRCPGAGVGARAWLELILHFGPPDTLMTCPVE